MNWFKRPLGSERAQPARGVDGNRNSTAIQRVSAGGSVAPGLAVATTGQTAAIREKEADHSYHPELGQEVARLCGLESASNDTGQPNCRAVSTDILHR